MYASLSIDVLGVWASLSSSLAVPPQLALSPKRLGGKDLQCPWDEGVICGLF